MIMKTLQKQMFRVISITLISLMLASCNTTHIISSWSSETPPANIMSKVLILGIMQNRQDNDNIENEMVSELRLNGINAVAATSIFGPKRFKGLNEEQITEKLKGSDFSSVMIVFLVDKEKEKNYTPGNSYATPRIVGYSRYYRRYIVRYDQMYTPGYYSTSTNYVLEADLYSVNDDDALIYSAQTKSYDPTNSRDLGISFAKSIVQEMKTRGLIK